MPKPKGFEWNQKQLQVAYELVVNKKNPQEIADEGICQLDYAFKVQEHLDAGDKPPSLNPDYIALAKPPSKFGKFAPSNGGGTKGATKVAEATEAPVMTKVPMPKPTAKLTDALSTTSILQFIPQIQQLPLTPDIFMSYMCALKKGYRGSVADWISLVSRDFWFGRKVNFYAEVAGFDGFEEVQ